MPEDQDPFKYFLEYVWLDGYTTNSAHIPLRSKVRIVRTKYGHNKEHLLKEEILVDKKYEWNYDGSSTNQAKTDKSEIILKPLTVYTHPFYDSKSYRNIRLAYIVFCTTSDESTLEPYTKCKEVVDKYMELTECTPRFGFEQEFFINTTANAIKSSIKDFFYCAVGEHQQSLRKFMDTALGYIQKCDLNITGYNLEVAQNQGEFQLDDLGVKVANDLWILRYILTRTAEEFGFTITFHPKPFKCTTDTSKTSTKRRRDKDPISVNGSGLHTNFSTTAMMDPDRGKEVIRKVLEEMKKHHSTDITDYGPDNKLRLTGKCETAPYDTFTYGVGDRTASVRIPTVTHENGYGYLEDRRPGANADPYLIVKAITTHMYTAESAE